MDTDILVTSTF